MTFSKTVAAIVESHRNSQDAAKLRGRVFGLQLATVTNNGVTTGLPIDETRMRRIKVMVPSMGLTETDWLLRVNTTGYSDPPLPKQGATVVVGFLDGDPHRGVWFGEITNARNPSFDQSSARDDSSQTIPGDEMKAVMGNQFSQVQGNRENLTEGDYDAICEGSENRRTERDLDLSGGQNMTIANDAQCKVHHDTTGFTCHTDKTGAGFGAFSGMVALADRFGNTLGLGGATGLSGSGMPTGTPGNKAGGSFTTDLTINLNGQTLHIEDAGDVTINGKSIAVIGARDSAGDVLVDRGY